MFGPQQATNYYPGHWTGSDITKYVIRLFNKLTLPVQDQMYSSKNVQNNIFPQPAEKRKRICKLAAVTVLQQQNHAKSE